MDVTPPDPMPPNSTHEAKLRTLPTRPGVYLFRDAQGVIVYVGKAKSLRSRVRSYFAGGAQRQGEGPRPHPPSRCITPFRRS